MRRIVALCLCAFLLFGFCAVSSADTMAAYERNEKGYPDLKGETFTVWAYNRKSNVTNDYGDYECVKAVEKLLNCNIEFVHPPVGQEQDNFAIMMAGDRLPDLLFCNSVDNFYPGGVQVAYADGILYDYTDLINETNTPNFVNIVLKDEFLSKAVYDDTGRIVRLGAKLCGGEVADFQFSGPVVRRDFLAQTGMDLPETIEDWYTLLTAMKDAGVEYPLAVSKGYGLSVFSTAWGIFASAASNGYTVGEDGEIVFGPYTDAYKDYLAEMNRWYMEGLINPDYMNTTDDNVVAMIMNDRVGSANLHVWNWEYVIIPGFELDHPEKQLVAAQLPKLNAGDPLTNLRSSGRSLGDYKYITADAKNPLACVTLLDALYFEEISTLFGFGIEGTGWTVKNGFPIAINVPETEPLDVQLKGAITEWHAYEDWDADMILQNKYCTNGVPDAMKLWRECPTDGCLSKFIMLTTEEAEVRGKRAADITTYVNEMQLKFITGAEPLENFEAYKAQLRELGVEEMIAVYQAAQTRFIER